VDKIEYYKIRGLWPIKGLKWKMGLVKIKDVMPLKDCLDFLKKY
jgi:hypothetical protein